MSVRWNSIDRNRFWSKPPEAKPVETSAPARWDAVVDKSQFTDPLPQAAAAAPQERSETPVPVKIWLFGELAAMLPERPVAIELPDGFSLGDVFAELGKRCGQDFLEAVIGPDGRKCTHCRAFVDGVLVEDTQTPVHAGAKPAVVELILITATEGG